MSLILKVETPQFTTVYTSVARYEIEPEGSTAFVEVVPTGDLSPKMIEGATKVSILITEMASQGWFTEYKAPPLK